MSVQSIYGNVATTNVNTVSQATENKKEENVKVSVENKKGFDVTAVVYEKSKETDTVKPNKNNKVDREAIIAQMKADTEARMTQMQDLVRKMMQGQGNALAQTDDVSSGISAVHAFSPGLM